MTGKGRAQARPTGRCAWKCGAFRARPGGSSRSRSHVRPRGILPAVKESTLLRVAFAAAIGAMFVLTVVLVLWRMLEEPWIGGH